MPKKEHPYFDESMDRLNVPEKDRKILYEALEKKELDYRNLEEETIQSLLLLGILKENGNPTDLKFNYARLVGISNKPWPKKKREKSEGSYSSWIYKKKIASKRYENLHPIDKAILDHQDDVYAVEKLMKLLEIDPK